MRSFALLVTIIAFGLGYQSGIRNALAEAPALNAAAEAAPVSSPPPSAAAVAPQPAPKAEVLAVSIEGEAFELAAPQGACWLDKAQPYDAAILAKQKPSLLGFYVACADLEKARAGNLPIENFFTGQFDYFPNKASYKNGAQFAQDVAIDKKLKKKKANVLQLEESAVYIDIPKLQNKLYDKKRPGLLALFLFKGKLVSARFNHALEDGDTKALLPSFVSYIEFIQSRNQPAFDLLG